MNVDSIKIAPEWKVALKNELEAPYFDILISYLKNEKINGKVIYPPEHLIFNAYNSVFPSDVKVVIIGQDPYHNPGEAMGLSFSVPNGVRVPPSLKNIYKELQTDVGLIPPQHGDLTPWTSQGVFLLNAILTVERHKPASHQHIGWQSFTDATISYLSEHYNNIVFMLWGNYAKTKQNLIDTSRHLVLQSAHPSPLARGAFFGCRHFSLANAYLKESGRKPVEWLL